jgi:hypothetical protein
MSTHCALSFSLKPEGKTGSTTRLKVNKRNATNISAKMAVFFLPLYFIQEVSFFIRDPTRDGWIKEFIKRK